MATVAVVGNGMAGHVGPLLRLARVLVRQGHRVSAWVPETYRADSEQGGAEFCPHEPISAAERSFDPTTFASLLAETTPRTARELINQFFENGIELIVHDIHMPWARVAAEFLGIPRVVSNPLCPVRDQHDRGIDGFGSLYLSRSPEANAAVWAAREQVGRDWGVELGDLGAVMYNPGPATLSPTTPLISGEPNPPTGWDYVGLLSERRAASRGSDRRPLVYVAFGTFVREPSPFNAVIDALAGEPVQTLVSTGGGIAVDQLRRGVDNVIVQEFVDSRAVLARARVHVTHGGGGSVHESLLAGVPMVCLPQHSDQFDWVRRVCELGVGERVEQTAEAIREGVRRVLEDAGRRGRTREVGEHLASFDGEARVAAVMERLLGRGGAARRGQADSAKTVGAEQSS